MDLDGLLNTLGDFLSNMADNSVEALTSLWNGEMRQAIETSATGHWWLPIRPNIGQWFFEELRAMKRHGHQLQQWWRKWKH